MEYTFETTFLRRPIRKLVIDDEFWYVVSDVFRAVGKDAVKREQPYWNRKWPKSCRRFVIKDKHNECNTVNALCAQADQLLECFGTEKSNRMKKIYRWLVKEWRIDMDWAIHMDHIRTVAACEDEEEKTLMEEMRRRDMDRRIDSMTEDKWMESDEFNERT